MTLRFAIPTPLSPLENHIDQYRYASIRSRDILLAPARQPLPVFHVKQKSCSSDAPFSTGDRPHLPLPAPRLQHGGARRRVKAGSDPLPRSTHSASGGRHWSGLVRTSLWFQDMPQPAARLSQHPTFWQVMKPPPFHLGQPSVRRCPHASAMTDNSVSTCFT